MHWLLFLEQALVPFGLLAWLALAPLRSGLGFGIQAGSTALVLLALSLTGPWLLVPWWVGYVYGGAWLLLAGRGWWGQLAGEAAPRGVGQWVRLSVFTALGLFGAWQTWLGWQGRALPTAPAVKLRFPLAAGRYLMVSGGTNLSLNPHADALDTTVAAHRPWLGTGYALDVVALDRWGRRAAGLVPTSPAAYFIYGTPVLAPCAGTVLLAEDGYPDMPVPRHDDAHPSGNYLLLRGAQADIVLAHFRRGSLRVRAGARVVAGQLLAQAGNSGATDEPHLHIHAQRPGPPGFPMGGSPLPMRFGGRFLVRNDRITVPIHPFDVPGSWLATVVPLATKQLVSHTPTRPFR